MRSFLRATPPWLGSKRQLAAPILRAIQAQGIERPATIADAFAGGCSLAITAKALGYRVLANDISPLGEATGKALIENSRYMLNEVEIERALDPDQEVEGVELPPREQLALPDGSREVLRRLAARAQRAKGIHRWLMRAWIVRCALAMSMWGMPAMAAGRRDDWDELTIGQAQQRARAVAPMALAVRCAEALNGGVFDNGQVNEMNRYDAVAFLAAVEADVAYLDPPYPGVVGYEDTYRGIARLLQPGYDTAPSPWSAKHGWKILDEAFAAAAEIPLWVVSMSTHVSPEAITELVAKHGREPSAYSLEHDQRLPLKRAHESGGDEMLIIGRKK